MSLPWLRLTVSLITAALLTGCGGGTHESGKSPDAASRAGGSSGASWGAGGSAAVDAAAGGSGGTSVSAGSIGGAGTYGQGGKNTSSGFGGSQGGTTGGGSLATETCCAELSCPFGYSLVGRASTSTCPSGEECKTFISCGCNLVLCTAVRDAGIVDAAGGLGGNAGNSGTGGTGGSGGATGGSSSCPVVPPCNWCGGQSIVNANGCVTGFRCANGANPCSTQPCSESAPCAAGYTCRDRLCWPGDAGAGGSGGTGGSSGSCGMAPSCNWCAGQMLKDANGCYTGYRCANGVDPCRVSPCSASAPCAAGYTCSNMLCWPNDGGAGDSGASATLCGGKVCGSGEACCGPPECGKCVNAMSGQYCPSTCTTQACGPSGAPCKAGEVCLDLVNQTTTTRTATASCQPNPCGAETLSCTCAKSLCGTTSTSCTSADPASGAVVCSTK